MGGAQALVKYVQPGLSQVVTLALTLALTLAVV